MRIPPVYCLQDIADKIFRDAFAFGSEGLCVLLQLTSFDENTIIDRTVPCIRECKLKVPGHKSETQFQFVFILRNDGKLFITHAIDLSREDQIDALSLTDDARALAHKSLGRRSPKEDGGRVCFDLVGQEKEHLTWLA